MPLKYSRLHLTKKRFFTQRTLVRGCALIVIVALAVVYAAHRNTLNDDHDLASYPRLTQEGPVVVAPDTAPDSGTIPAAHPRTISIPTAGVLAASITPVGITSNGEMATPSTSHEVGWYNESNVPSQNKGALVFNGHVSIGNQLAVFNDLHQLLTGEIIEVRTGENSPYRYRVYHVERLSLEDVDMRKMIRSVDPSKQGLNIITCAGEYDQARKTYNDRVLVYAVRM